MAFATKQMAFQYLPSSEGDLYDPAAGIAHIHNIVIHNTSPTTETVVIYKTFNGTKLKLINEELIANETQIWSFAGEGLLLDSTGTSKITGLSTTASMVVIDIGGVEET